VCIFPLDSSRNLDFFFKQPLENVLYKLFIPDSLTLKFSLLDQNDRLEKTSQRKSNKIQFESRNDINHSDLPEIDSRRKYFS